MLLSSSKKLETRIVECFGTHAQLSADDLHQRISGETHCARSAIYKELAKLLDQNVLVKHGQLYSLSIAWILDAIRFAEAAFEHALNPNTLQHLLPEVGKSKRWSFTSLRRMDMFWVQLMFLLFERARTKTMFEYVPHLWFPFIDWERDDQYARAMERSKWKIYLIIGGTEFLDRYQSSRWSDDIYECSLGKSVFSGERSTYYCLIADYTIKVSVDARSTRKIDDFFRKVKSLDNIDFGIISQIFDGPSQSTITLSRNPRDFWKRAEQFFHHFKFTAQQQATLRDSW